MTVLQKPVIREVAVTVRECGRARPLVIRLLPHGIELRGKGCRRSYLLPYASAWLRAAELAAMERRAERAKARAARKAKR